MAMHYRLELGDAINIGEADMIREVNREVASQMRVLAEIARSENISIIITNAGEVMFCTNKYLTEKLMI